MDLEINVRCLRYRLRRQGMLELDAWMSGLQEALLSHDEVVVSAINDLLVCEVPVLLEMMHGDIPIPDTLSIYLRKL